MSHVAEVYAKDLGVKIGEPKLNDHFYPNLLDKYVYFNPHADYPSQEYAYWDVVFSILKEKLEENNIVIFTAPKLNEITVKQNNFFIKKSLLYIGTSSHRVQISDAFNIPSVCVLGNMFESNFNLFKNTKIITPDFSDIKPSFDPKENKNRVNEIVPEQIAACILDKLNIKYDIKFKTKRIGSLFNHSLAEIVPNFFEPYDFFKGKAVNIRSDLEFNLQNIFDWCRFCLVNLYLNKPLDEEIIAQLPNLKQIIFVHNKDHEKEDLNKFFKILKNYKKNVIVQVTDKDSIYDLRLKYFDFPVVLKELSPDKIKVPKNCKYISNKKFISNGEAYNSESSCKRLDKSNDFVYDDVSKLELENLYLYVEK